MLTIHGVEMVPLSYSYWKALTWFPDYNLVVIIEGMFLVLDQKRWWCTFIFEGTETISRYSGIIWSSCYLVPPKKKSFGKLLVKSYCNINHRNVVKISKVNPGSGGTLIQLFILKHSIGDVVEKYPFSSIAGWDRKCLMEGNLTGFLKTQTVYTSIYIFRNLSYRYTWAYTSK